MRTATLDGSIWADKYSKAATTPLALITRQLSFQARSHEPYRGPVQNIPITHGCADAEESAYSRDGRGLTDTEQPSERALR